MKKNLNELKNMELVTNGYQVFKTYKKDYIDYDFYEYVLGGKVLTNDKSDNNIIDNLVINDIMAEDFTTLYSELYCNGYNFSELDRFEDLASIIFENVPQAEKDLNEQGYTLKIFNGGIFYLTENDSFATEIISNAYNFIHNNFNIVDKIELSNYELSIKDETSVRDNIIFNAKKVNPYNAMSILLNGYNNISLSLAYSLIDFNMVDNYQYNNDIYFIVGKSMEYYNLFKLNVKELSFDKIERDKDMLELLSNIYTDGENLESIAISKIRKVLSNAIIPVLASRKIKKANKVIRLDSISISGSPFYLLSNDSIQIFLKDQKTISVYPYSDNYILYFK